LDQAALLPVAQAEGYPKGKAFWIGKKDPLGFWKDQKNPLPERNGRLEGRVGFLVQQAALLPVAQAIKNGFLAKPGSH